MSTSLYSATILQISMMVFIAFSIEGMGTYSKRPCMFMPPAKILGQGRFLNDSWAPSVPPRMGCTLGVTPKVQPIRGGTDGAQLSFKNLPCPNIFAGGMNMHGRFEYVPIPSMEKAMQTIIEICKLVAEA